MFQVTIKCYQEMLGMEQQSFNYENIQKFVSFIQICWE